MARTHYDNDGIAYDTSSGSSLSSPMTVTTSTMIVTTTILMPSVDNEDTKNVNGTIVKQPLRKGKDREE
jgi:alpha-glucosidase (family GH31 glycosyl hydrolase)